MKISKENTDLFDQTKTFTEQGFWKDFVRLDARMIEYRQCPKCWKFLTYKGFSNATEYKAFGICDPCKYAKVFWTHSIPLTNAKKRFCQALT
jgi:hypothetical protein